MQKYLLLLLLFLIYSSFAENVDDPSQPTPSPSKALCSLTSTKNTVSSSIILDIEESDGEDTTQSTVPAELPIEGDPYNEVELKLVQSSNVKYFRLNGKRLQLERVLDREETVEGGGSMSSIVVQISCLDKETKQSRTIPVIIRVSDRNDNSPSFLPSSTYTLSVSESTPIGSILTRNILATDPDAGVNGLIEYSIKEPDTPFTIHPQQGTLTLNKSLDYEREKQYELTIVATDRAFKVDERRSSNAVLKVTVVDADDQGPKCEFDEYNVTTPLGTLPGILSLNPTQISCVDLDTLNTPLEYSFTAGYPPSYLNYFLIDQNTALIRQIRPIPVEEAAHVRNFEISIRAQEKSPNGFWTSLKLNIYTKLVKTRPPELRASNAVGFIKENSPNGTLVMDEDGVPIEFSAFDGEHSSSSSYSYQLTTSAFKIVKGKLVVNDPFELDYEKAPQLQFQLIARDVQEEGLASSPLLMKVKLVNVNDNSPKMERVREVLKVQSGSGPLFKVKASDADEDPVKYSIAHVSNGGGGKFKIGDDDGIVESVGGSGNGLKSGEGYSITVQATDPDGRMDQAIFDLKIVDGPNVKPPLFTQGVWDINVSEGAAIGSPLQTLMAKDPEGKAVVYDIVNGNELGQFAIQKNSGLLLVNGQLDREDLERYSVTVKATDPQGLSSTCTVNIRVLDINDQNPVFLNTPYKFTIKEGQPNKYISTLSATDADVGPNAEITYSIDPQNTHFKVDPKTGEVFTKAALDYEKDRVHYVVVTAHDNGHSQRISTATMTISVQDIPDSLPVFEQYTYETTVPENMPGLKILQVQAIDADQVKKITYYIKKGPLDKFHIDPLSGELYTTNGLDYEMERRHVLLIGTEENDSVDPGSTCTVTINVQDINDNAPLFTLIPPVIKLKDTSPVGMLIIRLEATDADGTSPNNRVRYELVGEGKSVKYFEMNHENGSIYLKDDLRKEMDDAYDLRVVTSDLGEPSLATSARLRIDVDHVHVKQEKTDHVSFSELEHVIQVPESTPANTMLKNLVVLNVKELVPLECYLENDEAGLFGVRTSPQKSCELFLKRASLDYEKRREYILMVGLRSLPGVVGGKGKGGGGVSKVVVKVEDVNDNSPTYSFPSYQRPHARKYFAAIASDAQISTNVMQVQADDKDSGLNGDIEYSLESELPGHSEWFEIEKRTGLIRNLRSLEDVSPSLLPFRLIVVAKDKGSPVREVKTPLVVNVIENPHRMILSILGTTPDRVKPKEADIINILQDSSNLIIGIEKIQSHRYLNANGSIEVDSTGTDVWFYAVDPAGEFVLDRGHPKVEGTITSRESVKGILYYVSSALGVRASEIRKPIDIKRVFGHDGVRLSPLESPFGEGFREFSAFPAALVALASLIFVCCTAGICFVCYKYSRYSEYKEDAIKRRVLPGNFHRGPNYEPFYIENSTTPSLKQYETQVLNMNCSGEATDDLEINDSDLQVDLNFTERGHYYRGNNGNEEDAESNNNNRAPVLRTFQKHGGSGGSGGSVTNPIYERSDDEDDHDFQRGRRINKNKPVTEL